MSSNNDAAIALLEKHFDIAFAAPDGIKKLRELILSLAMQGKLVAQDPSAQPASELLKEVEKKKASLFKEGKIKQSKPLPEIKPEELPYDLPKGWEWIRLATIGEINPRNNCEDDMDAGFVPMPLIFAGYRSFHKFEIRKWSEIKKGYTHFADGDVALAKITPCFENRKSCVFDGLPNGIGAGTTELHVFRNTFNCIYSNYLFAYFKNSKYLALGASKMTGSAGQKRIPTDFFSLNPFPLPPLAEQRRIVAKIDELMARCDELEKLRGDRDRKQITVHNSALNRLLIAKEQSDFNTAWQFITQHFSKLYSVKENVTELRKAILQLAVVGKLVPQDPNDQPASELLKEIEKEKEKLVKEGKIKKSKLSPFPTKPIKFPKGWELVNLDHVSTKIHYGYTASANHDLKDVRLLRITDIQNNKVDWDSVPGCDIKDKDISQYLLANNDILIARTGGTVGKSYLVENINVKAVFASYLIRVVPSEHIDVNYLKFVIESPLYWKQLYEKCSGTGQPNVNGTSLSTLLLPLPPRTEQHRIVSKIDQLMSLCDNLEKQIDNANSKQTNLLNAVMTKI